MKLGDWFDSGLFAGVLLCGALGALHVLVWW